MRLVRPLTALLLAVASLSALGHAQQSPYDRLSLPNRVSLELPRNWTVLSGSTRLTIDTAQQAIAEGRGAEVLASEFAFAANLYDDAGTTIAMLNARYYPSLQTTQKVLASFTASDLQYLDSLMRSEAAASLAASGSRLIEWRGSRLVDVESKRATLVEYRRSSGTHIFRVTVLRVADADKSFSITSSYREDLATLLAPISNHMLRSIEIGETEASRNVAAWADGDRSVQAEGFWRRSRVGTLASIAEVVLPVLLWLLFLRPFKPATRLQFAFRASLWPAVILSILLGGPLVRAILNSPSRIGRTVPQTLVVVGGLGLTLGIVAFAVGWFIAENRYKTPSGSSS